MITVCVEILRSEAIRRGIAAQGVHTLKLDAMDLAKLSSEQREVLAIAPSSLEDHSRANASNRLYVVEPTFDALKNALQARAEELAKALAERYRREEEEKAREAEYAKEWREKAFALPAAERVRSVWSRWELNEAVRRAHDYNRDDKEVQELFKAACALKEARETEDRLKKEKAEAERAAAEVRAAEAWDMFLHRFVGLIPSIKERFDAGMMPQKELRDLVRDWAFQPLDRFAVFEKLTKNDVEHEDECVYGHVEIESVECSELSADEFTRFKEISAAVDELAERAAVETIESEVHSDIEAQIVVAKCADCDATQERKGVLVTLAIGDETFSRRYAL